MKKIYTIVSAALLLVNSTQAQVSKVCFKPKTSWISATNFPNDYKAVATADFNNDGLMDVVAANLGANKIEVRLGTSTGTFVVSANIGSSPTDVKAADVNNDGIKTLFRQITTQDLIHIKYKRIWVQETAHLALKLLQLQHKQIKLMWLI